MTDVAAPPPAANPPPQPRRQIASFLASDNLLARASIYQYQQPHIDLVGWALEPVAWRGDERVLDVGCGPGQYLRRLAQRPGLQLIAMDLSRGMLVDLARAWDAAAPLPRRAVADLQALPLPDASLDVALAMHMLYHVLDIERAARELRRVLRPGGTLLAVTNSEGHLAEFSSLMAEAIAAIADAPSETFPRWSSRFRLENGAAMLEAAFERVERRDALGELLIPHADPILAYLESTRSIAEPMLPDGATWNALTTEIGGRVAAAISEHGVFRVQTHTAVFVCR